MAPLATPGAPQSLGELSKLLRDDTKVKVAGIDCDGVLRGKILSKSKFLGAVEGGGFGFCSSLFGWDIHDVNYTEELLVGNSANGYRDLLAVIDLSTFRRIPWEEGIPFFLVRFVVPETGKRLEVDPRSILDLTVAKAIELGQWKCIAGLELEYFQFLETPKSISQKGFSKLEPLTPGMHGYSMIRPALFAKYHHELYDEALRFGIDIEAHHTETGPGVYETALAYTEAERLADNTVLFKLLAKSIGYQHGIMPTFMAKPYTDLPGCSGHIHVSLRNSTGSNAFALSAKEIAAGGRKDASHAQLKFISREAEYFLAGLMDGLADVMPLFCPNINSYKRIQGGAAFWAPDTSSYGYDSRAASVRIISPPGCPPAATRFEVRIPGADLNPHYALAAVFGLGLRGIEKKLTLPYGPLGSDGVTRDAVVQLPISLDAALQRFAAPNSISREIMGNYLVDHFAGTRQHELRVYNKSVTSWEVERYFELA